MTLKLNPNLTLAICGSLAMGATAMATAPKELGTTLAYGAGLVAGAAIIRDSARIRAKADVQSERASATFRALYEVNKGIVDPMQLAILANIPPDKSHQFLTDLAENTGGQKIPVKETNGVLFSFPHAQNALDVLSKNAQNWATAQTEQLQVELNKYKQLIALQRAAQQSVRTPAVQQDPWQGAQTEQPGY